MPAPRQEDDDDLYEDDFEFVDDLDDDLDEVEEKSAPKKKTAKKTAAKKDAPGKKKAAKKSPKKKVAKKKARRDDDEQDDDEAVDESLAAGPEDERAAPVAGEQEKSDEQTEAEPTPAAPEANYVVHIYEHGAFRRTIQRDFTAEDAEAFATEYSRTAKPYTRLAVAALKDKEPSPVLRP